MANKKKKPSIPETKVPTPVSKTISANPGHSQKSKPVHSNFDLTWLGPEQTLKKIFFGICILFLVGMPILSFNFGITGDELVHKVNGENVLKYLKSGGADTTYRTYKNLYLYGGLFDASAAMIYENFPSADPYNVRHFLNAICGALLIIFTGLLAKQVSGRWAIGILALIFTALSPRLFGDSMNNPKDIPFAMAYVMAILGIIRHNRMFPKWDWPSALFLGAAIAISINIRVGGLLLLAYFGLYTFISSWLKSKQQNSSGSVFSSFLLKSAVLGIGAFFLGLIFFPYSHASPIKNTLYVLKEMENFQTAIRMLFEGRALWSDEIPWYYIPKWLIIALPLFIHIGLLGFLVFLKRSLNHIPRLELLFLLFVLTFPVIYAVYKHSALYDGIRHFLFIMPMFNVIAAIGWISVTDYFTVGRTKWIVAGGVALLCLLPLRFMIANHPNEYIYFNELAGGIKNAHGKYETDYWMNSMKELSGYLIDTDERIKKGDTIIVSTNSIDPVKHYFSRWAPNVKVVYTSYKDRYKLYADYYLSIPRFIDKDLLLNGTWPPKDVVKTVEVDGVPVGALTRFRDSTMFIAWNQSKKGQFNLAKTTLINVAKDDPTNDQALIELVNGFLNQDSVEQANHYLNLGLNLSPDNTDFLMPKALLELRQNKPNEAFATLKRCEELNYRLPSSYYYMAYILNAQKDYTAAYGYIEKAIMYAPQYKAAYLLGAEILQNSGNTSGAQQLRQMAN